MLQMVHQYISRQSAQPNYYVWQNTTGKESETKVRINHNTQSITYFEEENGTGAVALNFTYQYGKEKEQAHIII